jgi:hypothetical protein
MAMVRLQQKGLRSGGKEYQHFGEDEHLLRFVNADVAKYLADQPDRPANA